MQWGQKGSRKYWNPHNALFAEDVLCDCTHPTEDVPKGVISYSSCYVGTSYTQSTKGKTHLLEQHKVLCIYLCGHIYHIIYYAGIQYPRQRYSFSAYQPISRAKWFCLYYHDGMAIVTNIVIHTLYTGSI